MVQIVNNKELLVCICVNVSSTILIGVQIDQSTCLIITVCDIFDQVLN